jgi:hypothetical protein
MSFVPARLALKLLTPVVIVRRSDIEKLNGTDHTPFHWIDPLIGTNVTDPNENTTYLT